MDVIAAGMVCPVGLSAAAACAALRAHISAFQELPWHHLGGEPVIGAAVPGLPKEPWEARLVELLAGAVADCLRGRPEPPGKVPLLIALPEPGRPGVAADLPARVRRLVEDRLGTRFHPELSRVVAEGHAGGFECLRLARELLSSGAAAACLACGADSLLEPKALRELQRTWRLKTKKNADGLIPGEAGAAVLLTAGADGRPLLRVEGLGRGVEKVTVLTEEPLLGLGLADAARAALADAQAAMHEIDFRLADVTGESYGFKEQTLALSRLLRRRREAIPLWHVADSIGDAGAAAGLCLVVAAAYAFRKNYAPGERALCLTSSAGGLRAAAVVRRPAARRSA